MGLPVIVVLLLLSLQHAEVDSSLSVPSDHALETELAETSHHHQRRSLWSVAKRIFKPNRKKKEFEVKSSVNLKWEKKFENGVVVIDENNNEFYIAMDINCKPCAYSNSKCVSDESSDNKADRFLVNVDDFEILHWMASKNGKIPPLAVETCNGYFIVEHNNKLGYVKEQKGIKGFFSKKINKGQQYEGIEFLTLLESKEEYLTNITFNTTLGQKNKRPALLNSLTVLNNNCEAMKQQVKIDSGFDEAESFQFGTTVLIGGALGYKKDFEASLKADFGGSESETKSNTKKKTYGYTQDIVIPAATSCIIEIRSEAQITLVPFTAELTRVYKDDDIRTTSIRGNYAYQDSTYMKTDFQSCKNIANVHCPPPK